jgi:drug/metabolite transporter (DMT)-like permease
LRNSLRPASDKSELAVKVGLVLLVSLCFSITYATVDVAGQSITPLTLTVLRLCTAGLVLGAALFVFKPGLVWRPRTLLDIAIIGMLNVGLPFVCLATAVHYISSSLSSILFSLQPAFTLILAHFVLQDEKLSWVKAAGTTIAITGAIMLLLRNETGLVTGQENGWMGQLMIMAACLSGSSGVVYTRLRTRQVHPVVMATGQVVSSLIVLAPLALLVDGFPVWQSIPGRAWLAMLAAALSSPVVGFAVLFYLINRYGASLGGFAGIAAPFFSLIIGLLFLGEVITLPIAVGALLVLVGVWTLQYF